MKKMTNRVEDNTSPTIAQAMFSIDLLTDPDREFREALVVEYLGNSIGLTVSEEAQVIGQSGTYKPAA